MIIIIIIHPSGNLQGVNSEKLYVLLDVCLVVMYDRVYTVMLDKRPVTPAFPSRHATAGLSAVTANGDIWPATYCGLRARLDVIPKVMVSSRKLQNIQGTVMVGECLSGSPAWNWYRTGVEYSAEKGANYSTRKVAEYTPAKEASCSRQTGVGFSTVR